MIPRQTDPLLAIGMGIVLLGQALLALSALVLVVAIPILAIFGADIAAELPGEFADAAFVMPTLPLLAIMALALAVVVLVFLFLENLRRIIATVGQGDPFMPINAQRLTAMAWLMLAVEIITIPMAALGAYLLTAFDPVDGALHAEVDLEFSFSGLILVLTLFILARVFRQGAEMRGELEGTV